MAQVGGTDIYTPLICQSNLVLHGKLKLIYSENNIIIVIYTFYNKNIMKSNDSFSCLFNLNPENEAAHLPI